MGRERPGRSKRSAGQGRQDILTDKRESGKRRDRRKKSQKTQEERREKDREAQLGCPVSSDLSEGHRHTAGFKPSAVIQYLI